MFNAAAARSLAPGQHIVIEGAPGLRLEATATARAWTYRYRSPVDGRMRQVKLGRWPAMSFPAALAPRHIADARLDDDITPAKAGQRQRERLA